MWAWSVYFLNVLRTANPAIFLGLASGFFMLQYIIDYHTHPLYKHLAWYGLITTFGISVGISTYKTGFYFIFDVLYLAGNSISFSAIYQFLSDYPNEGMLFNSYAAGFFAMVYSVGFLRIIRCGLDLYNYLVYLAWAGMVGCFIPWNIFRSYQVQKEYNESNYNPISASLSYLWKMIP